MKNILNIALVGVVIASFGAAHADPQKYSMGQRWRGAQVEFDYIYMIDDNGINQGRAGEIKCGKKGVRIIQEADVDRLLKPLYDRLRNQPSDQPSDIMKPESPEFFAKTKQVASGRLVSEYYDRRVPTMKSYSYDLSKESGIESGMIKTAKELCADLDKK